MANAANWKELETIYQDTCCETITQGFRYDPAKEFDLDEWILDIYTNGKGKPHWPTINKYAAIYWDAVQNGYGADLSSENFLTPDGIMLQHLANNVYHFSAAKNFTHLSQLTALINNNGRIREWNEYKQEADKLSLKFNKTYLKTEYDLAIAGATMASKWTEFEATGDRTMLRYSTVGDARVRDSHRAMHNITLPIGHPFWKTNYPPNGFKCRCDVDRIPYSAPETSAEQLSSIDPTTVPPMFRTNLAQSKLVFPKEHPYFKGEVDAMARYQNFMPKVIATTDNGFDVYASKASKKFTRDKDEQKWIDMEYKQCIDVAKAIAEHKGEHALLLPEIGTEHPLYETFFTNNGYKFQPRIADILLPKSKTFVEVKSYRRRYNADAMERMISKANQQCNTLVIAMRHDTSYERILRDFNSRMPTYKNIQNAYVLMTNGDLLILK